MDPDRENESVVYGVVIGCLYALAIGIQVYVAVDQLTDGALTAEVGARWARLSAGVRERRAMDARYRDLLPWVRWDIHQMEDEVNRP